MTSYTIALIRGDGIGPEQSKATLRVLDAIRESLGIRLDVVGVEAGDECLRRRGVALPDETVDAVKTADACLKGPVGETAADVIVKLRQLLDLYANIRPARSYPGTPCLRSDVDLVIVRENTEDVYKGYEFKIREGAICLRVITEENSRRIARKALELSAKRRKRLTIVHKANVMRITCGLFRQACLDEASRYPDVKVEEQYVDAAAMNLIRKPHEFDVIVTTNLFGDILSEVAAQVSGGLGMGSSANLGDQHAIFEPVHGCAPDIAGQGIANPCSMILSAKMMLEWLGEKHDDQTCLEASSAIERALIETLRKEIKTPDLGGRYSTIDVGEAIARAIRALVKKKKL